LAVLWEPKKRKALLVASNERMVGVVGERDNLRRAYRQLMEQFELLRRRIFIAKAERVDAKTCSAPRPSLGPHVPAALESYSALSSKQPCCRAVSKSARVGGGVR
jgi:hypothetical protein